ncbi:hypothetical protein EVAR_2240_1 [Eumeta japonica]|uniref:Uncharacterized protein n=1 Tax=Eumeta variegata TaxID=151549 RepID=A0A4C1SFJ0_EUMVA|nr:hypothetical protein EVAR_2240_1 [Eumeta japonica]
MVYLRQEHAKNSWSKGKQTPQTVVKPGLTRNKLMLYVFWEWKGNSNAHRNARIELMCGDDAGSLEDDESNTHVRARGYQNCWFAI